ncbi:MAG TPA: DinB family protein [Chitinophagales bacterium]|nr:DinB family protein [Chitinophagales bacterium]HMX04336.1 DinB family protein [Chitinophagales bacterium]HMZ88785.1 DinB family protein [Chitinophagales bacterium]HNA57856.1 DinB family protein [Chitinophagales bacterium]HNE46511.1 DinB family protein [Chitinophagales bacterium]
MTPQELLAIYRKNLESTIQEVTNFPDDTMLWETAPGVLNSAGNLALHIAGNLRYFLGNEIAGTGYVRDRDAEFNTKGLSRSEVCDALRLAIADVELTLANMPKEMLGNNYPLDRFGGVQTTGFVLTYLLAHLNYHLGQVNYLRRILAK